MKKTTPKKRQPARKPDGTLEVLRQRLGVKVIETDRIQARLLSSLYHGKETAPMIKHALFQIFLDTAGHFKTTLPKNFTRSWLPYWATFMACNRKQRHMPTKLMYTWQPDQEEEATLAAQEEEENAARALFDLIHGEQLPESYRERISNPVMEILDEAHAFNVFEVFRVAWPLALEKVAAKEAIQQ